VKPSVLKLRVYYEDTDWGGVVYYANYLRYAEAARTEWLRERGIALAELHRRGVMFVVVEAHARYRAPARYDDMLELHTTVSEHTSLTITFESKVYNQHHKHLVTVTAKLACVGADGGVERIPEEMAKQLSL
jgi:acyl-CoA thioester hydrolase